MPMSSCSCPLGILKYAVASSQKCSCMSTTKSCQNISQSLHQAPAGMHALYLVQTYKGTVTMLAPQERRGKHLLGSFLIAGKRCAALLSGPLGGPQGPARG